MKRTIVTAVGIVLAFVAGGYVGWVWVPHPHQPVATPQAAPPQSSEEPGVFYFASSSGTRAVQLPKDYRITAGQALVIAGVPVANGGFTQNAFDATLHSEALPAGTVCEVIRTGEGGRVQTILFDPVNADPEKAVYLQSRDVIRIRKAEG